MKILVLVDLVFMIQSIFLENVKATIKSGEYHIIATKAFAKS